MEEQVVEQPNEAHDRQADEHDFSEQKFATTYSPGSPYLGPTVIKYIATRYGVSITTHPPVILALRCAHWRIVIIL